MIRNAFLQIEMKWNILLMNRRNLENNYSSTFKNQMYLRTKMKTVKAGRRVI